MLAYPELEKLALEFLKNGTNNHTQLNDIVNFVTQVAYQKGLKTPPYLGPGVMRLENHLEPQEEFLISQIVWDLIIQRILTVGTLTQHEFPFLSLTEFGRKVVNGSAAWYDADGYVSGLKKLVPNVDAATLQYLHEGTRCFKQGIYFAASAMLGAAAERSILLLLKSIGEAETDTKKITTIRDLLDRPKLPSIFRIIEETCNSAIKAKKIPYQVHQGCIEHLDPLFEMIRAHRNDSVHPKAGKVDKLKILLSLDAMPAALRIIYNLIEWFSANKI